MRFALINPNWTYQGSVYFGCRHPHFPLELAYSKVFLEQEGHEVLLLDAHLMDLSLQETGQQVTAFDPDFIVVTTAPTYLFWRCPQPELRVPAQLLRHLGPLGGTRVIIGPHGSATPAAVCEKLSADLVVRGECEQVLPRLADSSPPPSVYTKGASPSGTECALTPLRELPALVWPQPFVDAHAHHHHRFDAQPQGPGAELETSRGCPYTCTFCAKEYFRGPFRRRDTQRILQELDGLLAQGVRYVYFIDELFRPDPGLLRSLRSRDVRFGIQTRIDLWDQQTLELLGQAGCVSLEAGMESLSSRGRRRLNKRCRLSTEVMTELLISAKQHIAFVQANLLMTEHDDPRHIEKWRTRLLHQGVWANDPVPLFPYPGSPEYLHLWGEPDDRAWERAHEHYLSRFPSFSELQESTPRQLQELEAELEVSHG